MKYTPEEIAELLKERPNQPHYIRALIRKAVNAAVLAERESCAKACEDRRGTVSMFGIAKECCAYNNAADDCAAAIRARGNQ